MEQKWRYRLSGMAGGLAAGLFGGGGGMVLVPLFTTWCCMAQKKAFATCVAVILPISIVCAGVYLWGSSFDWRMALPYVIGGLAGGLLGGKLFADVPTTWLRRIFGAFLLYGAVRYLL